MEKEKVGSGSPLLDALKNAKPKFSSNQDALAFYSKEIEKLASQHDMSVFDLCDASETNALDIDLSLLVSSLRRKIAFFKKNS